MNKLLTVGILAAVFNPTPTLSAEPSIFNWNGFYIGGQAGDSWARSQESNAPPFIGGLYVGAECTIIPIDCGHKLRGFIGGGQAGYNWQAGNWVFGIETSFSGANVSGTETIDLGSGPNSFATKVESLLITTGRLGYAWDRTLLYAKAGYAGASVHFKEIALPGADTAKTTSWHNGWTVGAGIEYAVTPRWILGLEYNFADLGMNRRNAVGSQSGVFTPVTVDVDQFQSVLAKLSYKFSSR